MCVITSVRLILLSKMYVTLLSVVLLWFANDTTSPLQDFPKTNPPAINTEEPFLKDLEELLLREFEDWGPLVQNATLYGLPWARDEVISKCLDDMQCKTSMIKFQSTLGENNYGEGKNDIPDLTKESAKSSASKKAASGIKAAVKAGFSAVNGQIGFAADAAQYGLEYAGYEEGAKIVGASMYTALGAIGGASVAVAAANPVGAVVGGVTGLCWWGVNELAWKLIF